MNNPSTFKPTFLTSAARRALLLPGTLILAIALAGCAEPPRQRKNVKELTAQEKQDYVDAVLKLKSTPSPYNSSLNWYDQFVAFHKQVYEHKIPDGTYQPDASQSEDAPSYEIGHKSPTFLPWHRKFLLMYEQALREVSGKDISLPYWDWTDEASTRAVFSKHFMGTGGVKEEGYAVLDGPFRKGAWEVKVFPVDAITKEEITTSYLVRSTLWVDSPFELPTATEMEACLELEPYDVAPWNDQVSGDKSFRSCLEGWSHGQGDSGNHMHNGTHVWVGGIPQDGGQTVMGSMAAFDTSPNDPAFFLHHANVDRIWARWQQRHGISYIPGDGRKGWNPQDSLFPFDQHPDDPRVKMNGNTVGDMLDVRELGYEYR
jgi:tyrosinase